MARRVVDCHRLAGADVRTLGQRGGSGSPRSSLNHLGVEVTTSETVHAEIARLTDEGLFTEEELHTTCCFATQDKVWVTGPSGERWEVYTVLADSDTFGSDNDQPDETCCTA